MTKELKALLEKLKEIPQSILVREALRTADWSSAVVGIDEWAEDVPRDVLEGLVERLKLNMK